MKHWVLFFLGWCFICFINVKAVQMEVVSTWEAAAWETIYIFAMAFYGSKPTPPPSPGENR